jgi:diguanylate cyclase (GGDEF)-like protein
MDEKEIIDIKQEIEKLKKLDSYLKEKYEEMLKKEEAFLTEINEQLEKEITVMVLGAIKETVNKETVSLKLLRKHIRRQVKHQINKEIKNAIQKLIPDIKELIKEEVKNKSIEIINQLKRQTGKQLEKEVIEQVKETTSILREQKEESEKKAVMDELTGTFNRRYFETKLEDELTLAKRFRMKLSLLMIDIDHFKQINDNFGHQIGDVVLQETVAVIKNSLSSTDFLCRYGGEEFAVIMTETELEKAVEIAEKIRKEVEEHIFYGGDRIIPVRVSIGVAEYPANAVIKQILIEKADQALYQAKNSGRNNVKAALKE